MVTRGPGRQAAGSLFRFLSRCPGPVPSYNGKRDLL